MTNPFGRIFFRLLVTFATITSIYGFTIRLNPLLFVDLTISNNRTSSNETVSNSIFNYPSTQTDVNERFKLIETDNKNSNYVMFGARNRIVVISKNPNQFGSPLQVYESYFPVASSLKDRNCSDRTCANYILTSLPLNKSKFNSMICGTYYGLFKCLQAEQNKKTGLVESYDDLDSLLKAPKSINMPLSNENALHLSFYSDSSDYILYSASSWTDTSQYLSAHVSENYYQDDSLSKKIGVSKSFVKFVEANDRLFLFQNELSFDIDDGEKDRDILISTSLVTQICKNDQDIVNREPMPFFSELTAKIYCFNDAFKSSGNSRMFKFDSLDYVTDLFSLKTTNQSRRLFYGVFNTPKNQITGTAICLFDISDLNNVFQKPNFKFLGDNGENNAKNSPLNPQDCPKLSYMEKLKYKSFTSKLSYMTKSALPVRKRKASFMATNEYRITCLFVLDDHVTLPAPNHVNSMTHMNIIYAGTDNGKLLRIAHHFSDEFFYNEDPGEENVEILEEIQLFDRKTKINQISLLNDASSGIPEKLVVNSDQQIKAIGIDFCELYSDSCESCLKLNQMSEFRTKCMWRNGSCKTAAPTTSLSLLENCDYLKPSTTASTSPPTTPATTTTTPQTPKTKESSTTARRITSSSSSTSSNSNDLVVAMNQQTEFDSSVSTRVNGSSPAAVYLSDLFKMEDDGGSLLGAQFNKYPNMNGSSFIGDGSMFRKIKSDFQQPNEIVLFVIVSVTASICMLMLGILIGYVLKAKYSKSILKKFDSLFSKTQRPKQPPPSSQLSTTSTDISGARKFNPYQFATTTARPNDHSSLLYGSVGNKTTSSSSDGRCSRQNSNLSSENRTAQLKLMKSKNLITREYFTVQNDYGLLPGFATAQRHYLKPPPPIAPPQLPIQHRLSSTSSSTTDSSYCGVGYNLMNSQTCLINGGSQPPLSKQSNVNSGSEVTSETTTSTHISPVSRLVMSSTTTDSSYPPPDGPNNCIVVNDDDEEMSDGQSSGKPKSSTSSLSQNPSNRSTASSSSNNSTNWASLTRMSHQNRFFKHRKSPSSLGGSSSSPTRNFYMPPRPGTADAPPAAIYVVKSRLASLLKDDHTASLKVDDTGLYLNNSYV